MDLFNKKKVAALRDELTLATAKLEATTKELDDLKSNVLNSYEELTEYFSPKYVKKYFKMDYKGKVVYFRCDNLWYNGGLIYMDVMVSGQTELSSLTLTVSELKQLKITTKQDYLKGESK